MKKQTQLPMFPTGDDLPLFSGTAQTAQVNPYKATPPAPKQLDLFNQLKQPVECSSCGHQWQTARSVVTYCPACAAAHHLSTPLLNQVKR